MPCADTSPVSEIGLERERCVLRLVGAQPELIGTLGEHSTEACSISCAVNDHSTAAPAAPGSHIRPRSWLACRRDAARIPAVD